jgi:hypothetical protein
LCSGQRESGADATSTITRLSVLNLMLSGSESGNPLTKDQRDSNRFGEPQGPLNAVAGDGHDQSRSTDVRSIRFEFCRCAMPVCPGQTSARPPRIGTQSGMSRPGVSLFHDIPRRTAGRFPKPYGGRGSSMRVWPVGWSAAGAALSALSAQKSPIRENRPGVVRESVAPTLKVTSSRLNTPLF